MRRFHTVLCALGGALSVALVATHAARSVRAQTPPPVVDIWTWGANRAGQLGNVPPNRTIPWPMHESGRWTAVAAGHDHVLALNDAGEVWAWGANDKGQLGDGTTNTTFLPVRVSGLTGVTLIAAGASHSLAYRASDTTLWAWGSNSSGQLGADPAVVAKSVIPIPVPGLGALKAVAAGAFHSLALDVNGDVFSWGSNALGPLGLQDFVDRDTPTKIPTLLDVRGIGAGGSHSLAIVGDTQEAWAWGWNVFGQLGRGTQGTPELGSPVPAPVVGVRDIVQVAGGDLHSVALRADGRIWAWGYNTEGQVGNGDLTPANTGVLSPSLLTGIDDVISIAAAGLDTLAVRGNGELWTWGSNVAGACGMNSRADQIRPVRALLPVTARAATLGASFAVALGDPRPTSKVVVLGDAGVDTSTPVGRPLSRDVPGLTNVAAVSAGFHHALVLDGAHKVWAFGSNSAGQLGGTASGSEDPIPVDLPLDGTRGFVQVAARANQSFALRSDGALFAWGANDYGQLGVGDTEPSHPTPVPLTSLPGVAQVAPGERHAIALRGGLVYGWGQNLHGEIGSSSLGGVAPSPVLLPEVYAATEIAAGAFHSFAISVNAKLMSWGSSSCAQLGNDSLQDSAKPKILAFAKHVVAVSGGRFHSLALDDEGTIWTFGDPTFGQLGNGSGIHYWTPVKTSPSSTALLVAAGDYHSLAVGDGDVLTTWGDDSRGQLGRSGPDVVHYESTPGASTATGVIMAAGGLTFTVVAVR